MNHDYTSFLDKDDNILARLATAAETQLGAEKILAEAVAKVDTAKELLKIISEVTIPELMDEAKLDEFKTASGLKIKVKENIRASIKVENRVDAFAWLRENGHEAMIKRQITIQFGKGEDASAADTLQALKDRELPVDDKSSVAPATLSKFVREKLEAGEDVPMELLGVFRQRVSAVTV